VKTHCLFWADIMAVVQPHDGESFLSDFFKKDLDHWGEQVVGFVTKFASLHTAKDFQSACYKLDPVQSCFDKYFPDC
jgi:hypothetical protein